MSSALGRAKSAITPECQNISKSVKFSALVVIVIVLVAFVLLAAAMIYNYTKKIPAGTNADAAEASKKKVISGLTIASLVVLGLSLLVSLWQYAIVSKAVDTCI